MLIYYVVYVFLWRLLLRFLFLLFWLFAKDLSIVSLSILSLFLQLFFNKLIHFALVILLGIILGLVLLDLLLLLALLFFLLCLLFVLLHLLSQQQLSGAKLAFDAVCPDALGEAASACDLRPGGLSGGRGGSTKAVHGLACSRVLRSLWD